MVEWENAIGGVGRAGTSLPGKGRRECHTQFAFNQFSRTLRSHDVRADLLLTGFWGFGFRSLGLWV